MKDNKKYSYSKKYKNIVQNFLTEEIDSFHTNDLIEKKEIELRKFLSIKFFIILLLILILSYSYYDCFFSYSSRSNENKIKVAFYNNVIRYGGIERVTSILLNYFSRERNFTFYLITVSDILEGEYQIPENVKRITLGNKSKRLFRIINKEHIDIIIYNHEISSEIEQLNKLNNVKIIYCTHSVFFYRIYEHIYNLENTVYQAYKSCKYVLTLVPLENDYLFKRWGINSLLLENPNTFDYDSVAPSELSNKNIIMIGRGDYPGKRFEFGITAMKRIVQEIPESKMYIISSPYENLKNAINNLNLGNNVEITGFIQDPSSYIKNASLHLLPSLSESYSMVLGEAKMFGIPTILCGLDYLLLAKGGCINIFDDNPDTLAREAIKILKDDNYRKKLGKEARESMKIHKNEIIIKKWVKLLLSVYNGIDELSYTKLFDDYNKIMTEDEANIILNNQLNLIKKRIPDLSEITLEQLKSFSLK